MIKEEKMEINSANFIGIADTIGSENAWNMIKESFEEDRLAYGG